MNKKENFTNKDFIRNYPVVIRELSEIRQNVSILINYYLNKSKNKELSNNFNNEILISDDEKFYNIINYSKNYAKKYRISKKEYDIKPFSLDEIFTSKEKIQNNYNNLDVIMECVNSVFVHIMKNGKKENYYKNFEEKTKLDA